MRCYTATQMGDAYAATLLPKWGDVGAVAEASATSGDWRVMK